MKRDMDLMRAMLLEVESWPPGARVPSTRIAIEPYSKEQIRYHAELLHGAGFIGGVVAVHRASGERPAIVGRLTWYGHEFVDATRSEVVWAAVKERARLVGGQHEYGTSGGAGFLGLQVNDVAAPVPLPLTYENRCCLSTSIDDQGRPMDPVPATCVSDLHVRTRPGHPRSSY